MTFLYRRVAATERNAVLRHTAAWMVPATLSERNHVAVHRCDISVLHVLDTVLTRPASSFSLSLWPACLCSSSPLKQKNFSDVSFTYFLSGCKKSPNSLP